MQAQPEAQPFRLLGAAGKARLQQRLEAATRRWLDGWTAKDTVACSVRVETDDAPLPRVLDPLAESYRVSTSAAKALDVRFFPRGLSAVMGLPPERLASGPGAPRGLAAQLSAALLRGFVNELMDSASIATWQLDERHSRAPADRTRRSLSQRALVAVGERDLAELELPPLLVNALVPSSGSPSKGRLETCRGSIGKARLKIDAVLGNVELSLADFISLARGDVIVLGTALGGGCRVEVPAVAAIADAVVGKRGEQRAIRIRRAETPRRNG